ncbi:type II toxin-antitoxin system Phd/YefM family antitoxin [Acinetobacter sp.]|jgi:prevent-host-death family protein|uniref:type II toxin-antitoxin system Phd/YefM family antitoxin n=1 Tax=Acinetobacter sp. TaxID=472 RepID=UPI002EA34710|nr:type II toxin-antitoxin system prevent-host-death family antitoxin [Pseudomonadota bacterium]
MQVSTKELRIQSGKIIHQVQRGEEVTVTYRGKALAKIVPIEQQDASSDIFAMWQDQDNDLSVEDTVRNLRKGRQF